MMPGLGPTADGHVDHDDECPGDRNFLVTVSYNVTDVCNHEEAAEQFWSWMASTKDIVATVSEVPLGTVRSDPQEFDRRGRVM